MRIFKNAWFGRFAEKQGIGDEALLDAIEWIERGLVDTDLGGGVVKQRIARPGRGKSGGYRAILLYRRAERAFFVYGFAKSDRDNIDGEEAAQFKKAARLVLGLSEAHLSKLVQAGKFTEVLGHDKEISG